MSSATYAKRRAKKLCSRCGDVRTGSRSECAECIRVAQIKRCEREPRNPLCQCERRRILKASNWSTCWQCREEKYGKRRAPEVTL